MATTIEWCGSLLPLKSVGHLAEGSLVSHGNAQKCTVHEKTEYPYPF